MMTSSDFRVLWPAAVLCSGLRPIELLTVEIKPIPDEKHPHDGWWVCINNWAKKGENVKVKKNRDFCRDHPLLCPAWLWCRAIKKIRAHFNEKKLSKRELHQRYNKYWLQLLAKGFPQLVKPTHVLFRRFYAKYSFIYFQDEFANPISENSYTSWVLGHTSMEPALSYTNLHIRNAGKLNLWQIGLNLKTGNSTTGNSSSSKKEGNTSTGTSGIKMISTTSSSSSNKGNTSNTINPMASSTSSKRGNGSISNSDSSSSSSSNKSSTTDNKKIKIRV